MRKLRDIIHINGDMKTKTFTYYGIDFKEFIDNLSKPIDNILLLQHDYFGDFNYHTGFQYVKKDEISELCEDTVYDYGDFCWVDFENEETLDLLEPQEIAEILYLSHMYKPMNSAFFHKLNNRFAYCAHDDGWYCKLYCRDLEDFKDMLENVIKSSILNLRKRKLNPMDNSIKDRLLELSEQGLLIERYKIYKDERSVWMPIYTIGKFTDMDEMYNDLDKHKKKGNYIGGVEHNRQGWKIY